MQTNGQAHRRTDGRQTYRQWIHTNEQTHRWTTADSWMKRQKGRWTDIETDPICFNCCWLKALQWVWNPIATSLGLNANLHLLLHQSDVQTVKFMSLLTFYAKHNNLVQIVCRHLNIVWFQFNNHNITSKWQFTDRFQSRTSENGRTKESATMTGMLPACRQSLSTTWPRRLPRVTRQNVASYQQ